MTWREVFVAVVAAFAGWYVGGIDWSFGRVFLMGSSYVLIVVVIWFGFFKPPTGPKPLSNNEGGS